MQALMKHPTLGTRNLPVIAFKVLILCVLATIGACSASAPMTVSPAISVDLVNSYRLGTGDRLQINVFDEASLSGEFSVDADGSVSLPLIGVVPATGKTTVELTRDIRARLMAGYLRDPRVSIDMLSYRPFYILGEVMKPGEYAYSVGLTVLEAVAKAQGFTYRANRRQIYIKHSAEQQELQVALTSSTPVLPGDTLRIAERYF
jgi:polysaccharide export outer membrane protein